jgi:hypothetical protein
MLRVYPEMQRRDLLTTALLILALALSMLGQKYLIERSYLIDGVLFYLIAIVAFVWAFSGRGGDLAHESTSIQPAMCPLITGRWRLILLGAAITLSLIAFLFSGHNTFTPPGVIAWIASVSIFLLALWGVPAPPPSPTPLPQPLPRCTRERQGVRGEVHIAWTTVALLAILLLAAFFYLYRIDTIPSEMTSDHAEKILDLKDILAGERPINLWCD